MKNNRKDHRHWCQEELTAHSELEYVPGKVLTHVLGKASTYSSDKVSECKEFDDKNVALFEQVMMYIARPREQMADLHRLPF